jgi:hypothetical protein
MSKRIKRIQKLIHKIKLPQKLPYLFPNQLNPGSTLKLGFLIYSLFVSENPRDLPNGIKFSHPKVLTEQKDTPNLVWNFN